MTFLKNENYYLIFQILEFFFFFKVSDDGLIIWMRCDRVLDIFRCASFSNRSDEAASLFARSFIFFQISKIAKSFFAEVVHMKFLTFRSSWSLTAYLDGQEVGNIVVEGNVEVYSCKETSSDKKLRKKLEKMYAEAIRESPDLYSTSPLGSMHQPKVRRNLINMIITMNAAFPDYDFRSLKPDHFVRRFHLRDITSTVNGHLAILGDSAAVGGNFIDQMWRTIDEAIGVTTSKIWSYVPDMEADPFSDVGALWSFNYFFYNEEKKQILFFRCLARSRFSGDNDEIDEGDEYDDAAAFEEGGNDEADDEYEMNEHEYHRESYDGDVHGSAGDEPFRIDDL